VYRSFLSWRYMTARRTNVIGIVGIMVGVGALILILSIMTGFLEQSKATVRGSLSDVIIAPVLGEGWRGRAPPEDPEELLAAVRARPEVLSASAHLNWYGLLTLPGADATLSRHVLASSTQAANSGVQIVGIDVRTRERIALAGARHALLAAGWNWQPPRLQDEFTTTEFLAALTRGTAEEDSLNAGRVHTPLLPFEPPLGYAPHGLALPRALVGEQIYGSLGLRPGAEIEISTALQDPGGDGWVLSNRRFVVAGTFRTGDNEMDLGRIYLERSELADFLGGTQRYSEVLVRLRDYAEHGRPLTAALREELGQAGLIRGGVYAMTEVRTWEEFRGNLIGAIENERVLMMIMLSLVLLVAGFTVFAILSMMVTEKRRDIGILCALGATPKGILDTFLYIAFWDALIGATLGMLLGVWGALKIDALEQAISRLIGKQIFNRDVYLFDHIPSIVVPLWVALIVLGAFACALLFAAIPALRAARMHPLEALRYE
jgi:lipoprotein-releasing system permease protein